MPWEPPRDVYMDSVRIEIVWKDMKVEMEAGRGHNTSLLRQAVSSDWGLNQSNTVFFYKGRLVMDREIWADVLEIGEGNGAMPVVHLGTGACGVPVDTGCAIALPGQIISTESMRISIMCRDDGCNFLEEVNINYAWDQPLLPHLEEKARMAAQKRGYNVRENRFWFSYRT